MNRENNGKKKDDGPNSGYQKTLELMLDLENKLNLKQQQFATETKANINKINGRVEHAVRAQSDCEQRINDLEMQIQGELFNKV